MNSDFGRIFYTLGFCGIEKQHLSINKVLDLKYLFIPHSGDKCIIGGVETISLKTIENAVTCIEIDLSMHHNQAFKCLRCVPGDVISGPPKWSLVIHYDTLISGSIVFFHKNDAESIDINMFIDELIFDFSKRGYHINNNLIENIYRDKDFINKIIQFPVFCFHYKHATIMSRVENVLISKERNGEEYFLNINFTISTNMNLKSIRKSLTTISSDWEILSSHGSGTKLYSGEMFMD
ncbi:MAG: hypothetical protein PHZ07_01865 [Patescibacteria group bacterium]|nr:hypothetical protein [Patescibacteria group bacterium]MDD4304067.1 hypothetical protein [Patescibacteria group bacterium]MDD4694944.1 hypothetical protein [Patescibacteria group bacterium]